MPLQKHSVTLQGHRTSVALEDPFWHAFCAIAEAKSLPINALAAEIDAKRDVNTGLASAIRLFVLDHFQNLAAKPRKSD